MLLFLTCQQQQPTYLYDNKTTSILVIAVCSWIGHTDVNRRVHGKVGFPTSHERSEVTGAICAFGAEGIDHATVHVVDVISVQLGDEYCC